MNYFWLRWVTVAAHRLSLVAVSGGYSPAEVHQFSLQWLLFLWSAGSGCIRLPLRPLGLVPGALEPRVREPPLSRTRISAMEVMRVWIRLKYRAQAAGKGSFCLSTLKQDQGLGASLVAQW